MIFNPELKFAFVVGCLVVAVGSFFFCHSKRDWACLVGGLTFTVIADFFLVLHNLHLIGVTVFCFAHVCYLMRGTSSFFAGQANNTANRFTKPLAFIIVFTLMAGIAIFIDSVIFAAILYAGIFGANLTVNVYTLRLPESYAPNLSEKQGVTKLSLSNDIIQSMPPSAAVEIGWHENLLRKCFTLPRIPKINRRIILTGLILFALCDICVLLFNLPQYFGAPNFFHRILPMIWVFYLPSQALIAVSALKFKSVKPAQ